MEVQDTLERCLVPFFLLEGIAKQMVENLPFELKELSIGVKESEWSKSGKSIFKMLRPEAEVTKDYASFKVGEVPVVIWIIHRNYKFFEHPDFKWFRATEFYLPNPFALYWKSRFFIK